MKKLLATVSGAALLLLAILTIGVLSPSTVTAQSDDESAESTEVENTEANEEEAENYEYIAQPGDTYIQMARKAVQTYGIDTDAQIGAAGVLFAETHLASLAGWPALNEGQTVTISKASVKEWFDRAAQLSAEEKANWEYYVPFVDFNTNHVGEAPKN